ncbi:MAG: cation transporter [Oscillospiraceae bacterium]|nr:cation transporter [Oscillospiraceae bacterium]
MTKLLIRLFAGGDPGQAATRAKTGKLSGIVGIICNILLCGVKLLIGTVSGSVSITADAMNNLSDATSSVVTLVGFRLAEKPADDDHPYGHARYEYLSGLAVAAMIIVIGFELAKSSLEKILNPTSVAFSIPLVLVLVGSALVKLWLFWFNRVLGRRIGSDALLATAADSRNDVAATGAVLLAILVEHFTSWKIDGFMGMGVAVFILYSGVSLAKQTISPLLGETASPELQGLILDVVRSEPKILGYHDLMVHDYGPGQRFASIHVEMDEKDSALECHELIDHLERVCLREHNIHLVIHYDPVVTDDPELTRMRAVVQEILEAIDSRISIHDFRMVQGKENTNLIFDMALPGELMKQQKEIKRKLDDGLNSRESITYHTVVTFDMASFNE